MIPERRDEALTIIDSTYTLGGMCREMTCPTCQRPSWAGCGAHVEQVLGHVPPAERCRCSEEAASPERAVGARR